MEDSPEERRRAERVDVNAEFGGPSGISTFVANVSEHGVFVQTDRTLPLGAEANLRFTVLLDDPVVVEGRGRVVRHQEEPPGMGFEFVQLEPEMSLRLNDVIRRNRPRDSGPPVSSAPVEPVGASPEAAAQPEE